MPFGRVERDARAVADGRGNRPQPLDPAGQSATRVERGKLVDRFVEKTRRIQQRQVSLATRFAQPARILGIELAPHRCALVRIERQGRFGQRINQIGQREVDRYIGNAGSAQRVDRYRNHLARRRDAVGPDQFGTQLQTLARGVQLVGAQQRNIAGIA